MTKTASAARITMLHGDQQAVVHVEGEIDLASSPRFREHVREAFATGARTVLVDLSRASFLDSTGVGVLVGAAARASERGVDLVLRAPSYRAMRVLYATGLARRFRVVA